MRSLFEKTPIRFAACALSGLMLVACFPKIHLRGLVWVACLPLLAALASETRLKRAFLLGYVCGAFFFFGSCYWFTTVMEFYGHLAPLLAVVVLFLFVIIDSTFFGCFGLAIGWTARRSPGWALAASPFLWMAMELARTYLITGFPWNLLGYGVQAAGVRQIASVTGVYGLSFLAVATSALLTWVLLSRRHARAGLALTGWLVMLLVAQWSLAPPAEVTGKERAILIQPNVPLDDAALESWVPWRDPTQLQKLVQFSVSAAEYFFPGDAAPGSTSPLGVGLAPGTVRTIQNSKSQIQDAAESSIQSPKSRTQNSAETAIQNRKSKIGNPQAVPAIGNRQSTIGNPKSPTVNPPLLVWAENPAPFFFTRDAIFRNAVQNMARETHAIVIVNTIVPLDANGDTISNTAFTIDPEGRELSRYDKIHLVPFGEYVPGWAFPGLVHKITSEVGNFVPGTSYPVAKTPGGNIGVFICYEAIIPQLARKLVANGAGVLVNISNDAWYGDTAAAYQHLEMARLRAIENHRYLLRATNNGLTALIDPYGRVREQIPRYQRLAMPVRFDYETRETFYSARGDVFAWLCAALGGLMLLGASLGRAKEQGKSQSAKVNRQK
ncbi:MAG: apolipoprotein N-acyltransferase [Terriglobia bacterium]